LDGETDALAECKRAGELIKGHPIDVCFAGIGENGHLAFNDPPADFDVEDPYLVVNLDEACRKQQTGEGWFPTLADVPKQAISMSIKQVMKSAHLIIAVPDQRKAEAARACLEGPVSSMAPSSILQRHASCHIYLDKASSSLLSR
jgi:glucosamine-6-phosphate deaminase